MILHVLLDPNERTQVTKCGRGGRYPAIATQNALDRIRRGETLQGDSLCKHCERVFVRSTRGGAAFSPSR